MTSLAAGLAEHKGTGPNQYLAKYEHLKGTFLSESTDVFVITQNRQTFFFLETKNLNFGDF